MIRDIGGHKPPAPCATPAQPPTKPPAPASGGAGTIVDCRACRGTGHRFSGYPLADRACDGCHGAGVHRLA